MPRILERLRKHKDPEVEAYRMAREEYAIFLRYEKKFTYDAIASRLGVSTTRIHKLIWNATQVRGPLARIKSIVDQKRE